MSTNFSRAARLAASAALICLVFGNASAFAAAAAAGAAGAGAGAGAAGASGSGNGGPPTPYAAVVPPSDTNYPPRYVHRHESQKARDACPLQLPWCQQNGLD